MVEALRLPDRGVSCLSETSRTSKRLNHAATRRGESRRPRNVRCSAHISVLEQHAALTLRRGITDSTDFPERTYGRAGRPKPPASVEGLPHEAYAKAARLRAAPFGDALQRAGTLRPL